MKKQKMLTLTAFTSDPNFTDSFVPPTTHDSEMSVVLRGKDISIHGWDGLVWTTIYTSNGIDPQFRLDNTYQNYFLKSLTGQEQSVQVVFFSSERYLYSSPAIAGVDREFKFYDIDEVPTYTSSDVNKFLTVMSDGSLRWLGLSESYVVEVIGGEEPAPMSSFAEEALEASDLFGDAALVDVSGNKIFQNFPAGATTPGYAVANWSDYITYNSSNSKFEYTTMAVSFWFKLDSQISSTGQSNGYSIIGDKSNADGFHMFVFNSGTTHELYLGYRKPGNSGATKRIMNTSNGAGNSFVNGWNHALVVFHGDQTTFDIYANGSFVNTYADAEAASSFIGDVSNQNSQFAIGARDSSGLKARGFLVETDSIEIVQDVTLTESQVAQIAADSTRQTSINDV